MQEIAVPESSGRTLLLIALHAVFITIYYLIREGINPLALRTGLAFDGCVLPGMIALLVMIAGGIGITPFYRIAERLVRESDRERSLFFGNKDRHEIVYQDVFESLGRVRVVHVLSDEEDDRGETGYITPDLLTRHLGRDLREHEFLICGPPEMTIKLESGLGAGGIPSRQIHHELFRY